MNHMQVSKGGNNRNGAHWGTPVTMFAVSAMQRMIRLQLRVYMTQYSQAAPLCKAEQPLLQAITTKKKLAPLFFKNWTVDTSSVHSVGGSMIYGCM